MAAGAPGFYPSPEHARDLVRSYCQRSAKVSEEQLSTCCYVPGVFKAGCQPKVVFLLSTVVFTEPPTLREIDPTFGDPLNDWHVQLLGVYNRKAGPLPTVKHPFTDRRMVAELVESGNLAFMQASCVGSTDSAVAKQLCKACKKGSCFVGSIVPERSCLDNHLTTLVSDPATCPLFVVLAGINHWVHLEWYQNAQAMNPTMVVTDSMENDGNQGTYLTQKRFGEANMKRIAEALDIPLQQPGTAAAAVPLPATALKQEAPAAGQSNPTQAPTTAAAAARLPGPSGGARVAEAGLGIGHTTGTKRQGEDAGISHGSEDGVAHGRREKRQHTGQAEASQEGRVLRVLSGAVVDEMDRCKRENEVLKEQIRGQQIQMQKLEQGQQGLRVQIKGLKMQVQGLEQQLKQAEGARLLT